MAFEAREGIKGVKQLLEDQNYQQLEQKEKELIQCAPFDARGKMDLTERILKVKNSFLKKDITSTLEALRELETLFISINMDYNESAQKNT